MAEITLAEQIAAVEAVVKMRRGAYPRAHAFMSQVIGADQLAAAESRIERENAAMEAALKTLKSLAFTDEACPDECDHTINEHCAFDEGVMAGERGEDEETCPHRASDLCEAWLAGHSVGSINRESNHESTTANNGH